MCLFQELHLNSAHSDVVNICAYVLDGNEYEVDECAAGREYRDVVRLRNEVEIHGGDSNVVHCFLPRL